MARLAIKWTDERDMVSKYPAVEKTFERFCRDNNLKPHEVKLARAFLNYTVTVQQAESCEYNYAVKAAFAFVTGYTGANGVSNSDMAEIIGFKT